MREVLLGIILHSQTVVVTKNGIPVVSHVKFLIGLPRVAFVYADQLFMSWILRKETTCKGKVTLIGIESESGNFLSDN